MTTEGGRRVSGDTRVFQDSAPLLTVVTVVRNDVRGIEGTIRSVVEQDYPNIEYIVVDGASSDGTLDIIRAHDKQIDHWISEPDRGIYDAMNKGVELATGGWLSFLNSSDLFYGPTTTSELCRIAAGVDDRVKLIYGDTEFYDDERRWVIPMKTDSVKINLVRVNHQSCIMKNGPWLRFDTRLTLCADHDLIFPLVKGRRTYHIPRCVATVRSGGQSANKIRTMRESLRVSFRHGGPVDFLLAALFYYYTGVKWLGDLLLRLVLKSSGLRRARRIKDILEQHI